MADLHQKMKNMSIEELYAVHKNNRIVVWGAGFQGGVTVQLCKMYGIEVIAVCDKNEALHGTYWGDVPIISSEALKDMAKDRTDIVVRIAVDSALHKGSDLAIAKELAQMGIGNYIPFSWESMANLYFDFRSCGFLDPTLQYTGRTTDNKIAITKIDERLEIYKKNRVILYIANDDNNTAKYIKEYAVLQRLLVHHGIAIDCICTENTTVIKEMKLDTPIISLEEMEALCQKERNCMVQIGTSQIDEKAMDVIQKNQLPYVVQAEAIRVLEYLILCENATSKEPNNDRNVVFTKKSDYLEATEQVLKRYVEQNQAECYLFICMVGKTGDHTINKTLTKHAIPYINLAHSPSFFNQYKKDSTKKIKLITAVREPIGQYVSSTYEIVSLMNKRYHHLFLNQWLAPFEREAIMRNGGDMQYIFDKRLAFDLTYEKKSKTMQFLETFQKEIVDISDIAFDKEKGYGIVKKGNIEVFVYQLEKMNDLVKELADFVGTPFDTWEMGNVAADKWIANSYKQAQKEIKISKEFFDMSYNEPWVSHFYPEADIEKFKAKWRPHIKEEQ